MVKFFQSVREDILNKDIYIWNVNTNSMGLFTYLGMMYINVKGFVNPKVKEKNTIMNRPIITIDIFNKKSNAVLITSDECVTIEKYKCLIKNPIYNYAEILSIDKEILKKNIYIYGMGRAAKSLTNYLNKHDIKIKGYVTTKEPTDNERAAFTQPGKKYDEKDFTNDDAIIISAKNYSITEQILINCINTNCDIYMDDNLKSMLLDARTICVIDQGIKENKKIFVITRFNNFGNQTVKFLKLFGIEVINKYKYELEKLLSLITDNPGIENNIIVMIDELEDIKKIEILDKLKSIGFSLNQNNIVSFQTLTFSKSFYLKNNDYLKDALCTNSQKYDSVNSCGWKIFGKSNKNNLKVVILGGSTSTEDFFSPETWMKKLYKKLNCLNIKSTFYIGAAANYRIVDELLRFLRDGHIIRPDIVISMSGVNDTEYIDINNKFNINISWKNFEFVSGLNSNDNCYEFWLRYEMILKLYVEFLNAKFFCFLQPMNYYIPNASIECKMMNEEEPRVIGCKDFVNNANNEDIYTNLIGLFHNNPEMFIDECHYTDKAADILSDKVLETIIPTLKNYAI